MVFLGRENREKQEFNTHEIDHCKKYISRYLSSTGLCKFVYLYALWVRQKLLEEDRK